MRPHAPVVLHIAAEEGLTNSTFGQGPRNCSYPRGGRILKKPLQRSERDESRGLQVGKNVVLHTFQGEPDLDGVQTVRPKRVVIKLVGVPVIVIGRIGTQTAACALNSTNIDLWRELRVRRVDAESLVLCRRVNVADRRVDDRRNPAEPSAQRIGPRRTEDMVLLKDHRLTPGKIADQPGVQG